MTGVLSMSETKTRTPYTPPEFYDISRSHCPNIANLPCPANGKLDEETTKQIVSADIVIFTTRNARSAQYQMEVGMELGNSIRNKLIIIATCYPYDFLDENIIQNYVTHYEPTIPAFESAAEMLFGVTAACGKLPVCNVTAQLDMDFEKTADLTALSNLWNESLPNWKSTPERFANLVSHSVARHLVLDQDGEMVGACLTHQMNKKHAQLTAIIVPPRYQNQGLGTALFKHARSALRQTMPELEVTSIGAGFPSYWPGLPMNIPDKNKQLYINRGFLKTKKPSLRDFYQNIRKYNAPASVFDRAAKVGVTFAPWREDLAEECMVKQRNNFGNNAVSP